MTENIIEEVRSVIIKKEEASKQPVIKTEEITASWLAEETAEMLRKRIDNETPGQILDHAHIIYNTWGNPDNLPEIGIDIVGKGVKDLTELDNIGSISFQDRFQQNGMQGRRWLTLTGLLSDEGYWQVRYFFEDSILKTEGLNEGRGWRMVTERDSIDNDDLSLICTILSSIQSNKIGDRLKKLDESRPPYDPAVGIV